MEPTPTLPAIDALAQELVTLFAALAAAVPRVVENLNPRCDIGLPHTPPTGPAQPEAGDFTALRAFFGIPRSTAYMLEKSREIKFFRLRKRGNVLGKVLIDFDSVRRYLARCKRDQGNQG